MCIEKLQKLPSDPTILPMRIPGYATA